MVHIKIVNTPEGFQFSDKKFPDLAQLVIAHRQLLVKEYVDPLQRVVFNVGGRKVRGQAQILHLIRMQCTHAHKRRAHAHRRPARAHKQMIFLSRPV